VIDKDNLSVAFFYLYECDAPQCSSDEYDAQCSSVLLRSKLIMVMIVLLALPRNYKNHV